MGQAAGVLTLILGAVMTGALPAQTVTTLHDFCAQSACPDGSTPSASLVQGLDGNLYGTTYEGGIAFYDGTIFKISPAGVFTTVYRFCSQSGCADGSGPAAALIQGKNGNFYGTTKRGGPYGGGTVFEVTPEGALTTLYSFCLTINVYCTDGEHPGAGLIQAANGNFYGTTLYGGANGMGTVFELTPSGSLTVLYSFCPQFGCIDGDRPAASLIQAGNGNLYGTTEGGGTNNCPGGCGTVFQITPAGAFSTIYTFCPTVGCTGGSIPAAGLIQGTDGYLYGTASQGGNYSTQCAYQLGTIFQLTPSGSYTTIYSFVNQGTACGPTGAAPITGLVQGTDGQFYGTTLDGGSFCGTGCGTLFRVTSSGVFTLLYSFCLGCTEGQSPDAALIQDTNGEFYGSSNVGGPGGGGAVFSLSVGLGSYVKAQTDYGKVGTAVEILGTGLTGATGVTFNGTPASFKVVSSSLLTAAVPSGASSGIIQVVTPRGTLLSNLPFQVLP